MEIPIKNYDNTDKMQSTQSTDIQAHLMCIENVFMTSV